MKYNMTNIAIISCFLCVHVRLFKLSHGKGYSSMLKDTQRENTLMTGCLFKNVELK